MIRYNKRNIELFKYLRIYTVYETQYNNLGFFYTTPVRRVDVGISFFGSDVICSLYLPISLAVSYDIVRIVSLLNSIFCFIYRYLHEKRN